MKFNTLWGRSFLREKGKKRLVASLVLIKQSHYTLG